jgi:putative hydrolase of the HAD superfamily
MARPGDVLSTPEIVTFDCWNTLLVEERWGEAHALRVDALLSAIRTEGLGVDREAAHRAFETAWGRHMQLWAEGTVSGAAEVARWSLEALSLSLSSEGEADLVRHFEEASHSGQVVALDGAMETLEELARAGVAMALICDTGLTPGRVVRRHLDRLGLLGLLRAQIFSDEVGVPKPDARIFAAALRALEAPAENAVHVGDLLRTDVAGARGVGMTSVRIRQGHDDTDALPEAHHVVDTHAELRTVLGLG